MPACFVADAPPGGSRVKPEADEFARRNRGSMNNYLDQSANKNHSSPRPAPRTGGNSDCAEQMAKHRGSMNDFMDQKKNQSYQTTRKPPKCNTPEAQEQYNRAKGSMTEMFQGHGGKDPRNKDPHQSRAVKPEAAQIMKSSQGLGTKKLFETYGKVTPRPPPGARVKPEASGNAANNNGSGTKALFHNYGNQRPEGPRVSRAVNDEGREMAKMGEGGRAKSLLAME